MNPYWSPLPVFCSERVESCGINGWICGPARIQTWSMIEAVALIQPSIPPRHVSRWPPTQHQGKTWPPKHRQDPAIGNSLTVSHCQESAKNWSNYDILPKGSGNILNFSNAQAIHIIHQVSQPRRQGPCGHGGLLNLRLQCPNSGPWDIDRVSFWCGAYRGNLA